MEGVRAIMTAVPVAIYVAGYWFLADIFIFYLRYQSHEMKLACPWLLRISYFRIMANYICQLYCNKYLKDSFSRSRESLLSSDAWLPTRSSEAELKLWIKLTHRVLCVHPGQAVNDDSDEENADDQFLRSKNGKSRMLEYHADWTHSNPRREGYRN